MSLWNGILNLIKDVTDLILIDTTAIKAKTDNLPTDPADQSQVESAITSSHSTTDALVTSEHVTTDALVISEHVTTDALVTSEHSTTDSKIDTVDGFHDVPSQNSVDNAQIRDVLGNKTDDEDGTSVYAKLYIIEKHQHSKSCTYPGLFDSILLQKAAGIWAAYPTPTQIIPASTVGSPFDLHWVNVNTISANGDYNIKFYKGAALSEVEICCVPVSRSAVQSQEGSLQLITELLPADTRISAAISSSNNAQDTLRIKVVYHIY